MSDGAAQENEGLASVTALPRGAGDAPVQTPVLQAVLARECEAMLHYALDSGKEIPAALAQQTADVLTGASQTHRFGELVTLHSLLSQAVAPASGRTLVLFDEERRKNPRLYAFGPVRLVRQMLAFAALSLFSTGVLSTLPPVNVANVAKGWFELDGLMAYAVLAFLVSVAGMGAAFSNLSVMKRYIENANYDPIFEGSYWVRIVLGLISGVVLGEILFDLVIQSAIIHGHELVPAGERIVLSFLGGFATAPVQKLLNNLSDAVGTLLQGKDTTPVKPARTPAPTPEATDAAPQAVAGR